MNAKSQPIKILVIGGSGFIGKQLVRLLTAAGHSVSVFDRSRSEMVPGIVADIRDVDALAAAMKDQDVVYNLVAEHRDDVRPVELYDAINVGGARNVCEALLRAHVPTLIFTSSVAVYGESPRALTENSPHRPANNYGRTKSLAEDVYREWLRSDAAHGLTIVRPTVVFGPGNRGNVYNLIDQIRRGRFVMIGDGLNRKSMAFVENVAAFLMFSLHFGSGEHVYNYADKPDFDMNQLVSFIRAELGKGSGVGPRLPLGLARAMGLMADAVAALTRRSLPISSVRVQKFLAQTEIDSTKALAAGFRPSIDLRTGLRMTIERDFSVVRAQS